MRKQLKIISLATLLFTLNAFAGEGRLVKTDASSSRFSSVFNFGTVYTKVESRSSRTEYDEKFFFNAEALARYAVLDRVAVRASLGKWFGSGELSSNAGSVAYNLTAGLEFALTGSFVNRFREETYAFKRKVSKDGQIYYISSTEKTITMSKVDGFRVGIHATQMDFSKLSNPSYGFGGSIYYEKRHSKNSFVQYGFKFDNIDNSHVSAQLAQFFVGIGMFP